MISTTTVVTVPEELPDYDGRVHRHLLIACERPRCGVYDFGGVDVNCIGDVLGGSTDDVAERPDGVLGGLELRAHVDESLLVRFHSYLVEVERDGRRKYYEVCRPGAVELVVLADQCIRRNVENVVGCEIVRDDE